MSPEERYAKIDERISAIAMHLELTAAMVQDNEKRAKEENEEIRSHIDRILGIVETLAHTAGNHDARIRKLEGG